jgi:hypothetical protein
LCYAPAGEASALLFGNRSAVYLKLAQFQKCLENIKLAKDNNYPVNKMDKLIAREEKCIELEKEIEEVDPYIENEDAWDEIVMKGTTPINQKAPFYIAECLEKKKNSEYGRHIVSKQDLSVGTFVAIDEPFSKTMCADARRKKCLNCFAEKCMNLMPCEYCTLAMYCSEECKKIIWDKIHKYECPVVNMITEFFPDILCGLHSFLEALYIFQNDTRALIEFLKSIENSEATILDFDFSEMDRFERSTALLHTMKSLYSTEKLASQEELLITSIKCAILSNIMLNHTKLGSVLNGESCDMFREFIYKQAFMIVDNDPISRIIENPKLERDVFATGIFPLTSLINHSCNPNITRRSYKNKNYLFVSKPVKAGDQLLMSYG